MNTKQRRKRLRASRDITEHLYAAHKIGGEELFEATYADYLTKAKDPQVVRIARVNVQRRMFNETHGV